MSLYNPKPKTSEQVIDDICDSCPRYCTLKEIFKMTGILGPRVLEQLKCVDIFKYEESVKEGRDIKWGDDCVEDENTVIGDSSSNTSGIAAKVTDGAIHRWEKKGYAVKFAEFYQPGLTAREIYEKIKQSMANETTSVQP